VSHKQVCMSIAKLWKSWRKSPEAEFARWPVQGQHNSFMRPLTPMQELVRGAARVR
jgi:hypothetical protein